MKKEKIKEEKVKKEKVKQEKIKAKESKKRKKEQQPFDFKKWLHSVLEQSSRKSAKNPKIKALFYILLVQCEKSKTDAVIECEDFLNVHYYVSLPGYTSLGKKLNPIATENKEVDIVLSFISSEVDVQTNIETLSNKLKQKYINDFYIYAIKPTSADLNLVYLLKGV